MKKEERKREWEREKKSEREGLLAGDPVTGWTVCAQNFSLVHLFIYFF